MGDDRKNMVQRLMYQQKVGGMFAGSFPVHQCPKCKSTDAPGYETVVKPLPVATVPRLALAAIGSSLVPTAE
jgi:hypothetical protein